jgi:dihydroorotase
VIDVIVTDHAPHTYDEKNQPLENAPYGFSGFEISFGLLGAHVAGYKSEAGNTLDVDAILRLMTSGPARQMMPPVYSGNAVSAPGLGFEPLRDFQPRSFSCSSGLIVEGVPADITLLDLAAEWTVDTNKFNSKGKNTPFRDWNCRGRSVLTVCDGQITHSLMDGIEATNLSGVS